MKAEPGIIEMLTEAIQSEIAAIISYTTMAAIQGNIGLDKAAEKTMEIAKEEMSHFDVLMDRVCALDATPDQYKPDAFKVSPKVTEQMKIGRDMETVGIGMYNRLIVAAVKAGDDETRVIFEGNLREENQHILYYEENLQQITLMGEDNWLSTLV